MNLKRIIGWFLLAATIPYIIEQVLVLARDPWAIEPTNVFFMLGPEFHNATLLILSVTALTMWFTSRIEDPIQRAEGMVIRLFCAVCFYEVVWHVANGIKIGSNYVFTWQWWLTTGNLIDAFPILTVVAVVLLLAHNKLNRIRNVNAKPFALFFSLFIICFLMQGYMGLDWSPLAIRHNIPFLWLATKVLGYSMWIFL